MRNPIRRNRLEKTGVGAPLGELETAVMRLIWDCGEVGCLGLEVQRAQAPNHPVALTTVLTTLDRLLDKGILRREREGKAYRYWAALSEDELQRRIVGGVLDRLIAQFPSAVAAYFVQQESAKDVSLLELAQRLQTLDPVPETLDPVPASEHDPADNINPGENVDAGEGSSNGT